MPVDAAAVRQQIVDAAAVRQQIADLELSAQLLSTHKLAESIVCKAKAYQLRRWFDAQTHD